MTRGRAQKRGDAFSARGWRRSERNTAFSTYITITVGTVSRDFYHPFFMPGPFTHMLEVFFSTYFGFHVDVRMCKKLRGVIDTADSEFSISLTTRSQTEQRQ